MLPLARQLEIEDCHDRDAFAALDKAEQILQSCRDEDNDNWVENWLAAQLSRSNLHYWRGEAQLQAAVLERARSLVENTRRAMAKGRLLRPPDWAEVPFK